jgi:hypothetical protein
MNFNQVLMAINAAAQLFILHTDSILLYTVTLQTNKTNKNGEPEKLGDNLL